MMPPMHNLPSLSPRALQYLRLSMVEGIGPILSARLVQHFGGIDAIWDARPAALRQVRGISDAIAPRLVQSDPAAAQTEAELAARAGVRILCIEDPDYPVTLKNIPDPPPILYVQGTLDPADSVALAIVGSRHCSTYGREQAERFAALAAEAGFTIVSGLARGIDAAAHRGALIAGGRTLAVIGCGLSHLYPPDHRELADKVVARGALISEFAMGVPPDEHNFPRRNRIIAGLSLGTLVIEAPARSGALITARLASEYNREVFALPGRVDTAYSAGVHALIREGAAKLVTNLPDILDELGDVGRVLSTPAATANESPAPATPARVDEYEQQLLDQLGADPVSLETLTAVTGLPPARVAAAITSLQLKGLARRQPGDVYVKAAFA